MNIKKIVMSGVLVVGIGCSPLFGKEAKMAVSYTAEAVKTHGDVAYSKVINREITDSITFYGSGEKLIIKQIKNPCLFIMKEFWEDSKGKKLNDNTVQFGTYHGAYAPTGFYDVDRPSLNHLLVFHDNGKITIGVNGSSDKHGSIAYFAGKEVIQVLGKKRNCYLKPTIEKWEMYAWERSREPTDEGTFTFK